MGPITEQFESEMARLLDVPFAIATTSGSVALLLALMALDVGHGDEVIVPNRTFIATAHAALMVGARVILVDTAEDRPIFDCEQLESKISSRTKAIIPVHRNGRAADMERISTLARSHNIWVIEDAAQALLAKTGSLFLGTIGDIGCFSFGITKLVTTGYGGLAVTRDEKIAKRLKRIRNHGIGQEDDRYDLLGNNFKFSDMLASIGLAQLVYVDDRIKNIKKIYRHYLSGLAGLNSINLIPVDIASGEIPLWIEVIVPERNSLIAHLNAHDIEARPFYPSLNESPHLHNNSPFPRSERFARRGLILPCGPHQPLSSIERVIQVTKNYTGNQ